jgi:hypothetical protein
MNKEMPEIIFDNLINLLQSAEAYANRNSYQQALDIYAQVIDTHLVAHETVLIRTINEFLPQLDILLVEASCLIISEPSQPTDLSGRPDKSAFNASLPPISVILSPLLTPEVRRSWLKRLFTLWLKCRDMYQIREQLQQMMVEVAWSEDVASLRNLVESELHHTSLDTHMHVSGIASQSHAHTLEKFLKELPQ